MLKFLLSRLLSAALVILGVVSMVFLLIHLIPGDPVDTILGEGAGGADRAALRHALGLDLPLGQQYVRYLAGIAHLDLGRSLSSGEPVAALLRERLPATLELAALALLIAVAVAAPLGIMAALKQGTLWDRGSIALALFGVSMPSFWLGPVLILLFAVWLGWLPVSGREEPGAIILPALTLGFGMAAILARMLRVSILEVLGQDYVRTARAKGLPAARVIGLHVLRNALLPVLTVFGLQLGTLLGGAVITEAVFSWPGLGSLVVEAIQGRDYPVVQGGVLLIAVGYVLANTLTDLAAGLLDPRVRRALQT
ncbi:MAG: nickel ABC transporter permease [Pseudomonadota bacterium]|uniref:nickel ABC transporter permease n=1 Tax=Thermithiobacillus tepidarius TaxID=929 RepID=UPI0003FC3324|nr:nickel ABC transporter permease [Thermithiobacillus tepidarius]